MRDRTVSRWPAVLTVLIALLASGPEEARAQGAPADTVRVLLGGHMYGLDGFPAQGFQAGADTFASFDADAYVAGGDITQDGLPAEWDNVFASFNGVWAFPFLAVPGNHDLRNPAEWALRVGPTYYTTDLGSVRVIALNSIEYPNNALSDAQLSWLEAELLAAASDAAVESVLLAMHHLFWIKSHPRYEARYQLGNAWYDDFSNRGYDVNHWFEDVWPSIVDLAALKPVTFFGGDTGWTAVQPGLFYDVLDGVQLVACGFNPNGAVGNDCVVLYIAVGDEIAFQTISPWGNDFGPLENWGVDYWNAYFASTPSLPLPFEEGPPNELAIPLPSGTFEMGNHIDPRYEGYSATTGYSVTLSPFVMSTREVTVEQYLLFLNAQGDNDCNGYECIDLDDPEAQIEFTGTAFIGKPETDPRLPVVELSWSGALAYCNYLSVRDGLSPVYAADAWDRGLDGWRLPTDAEYEYAMRGGEGYTSGKDTYYRFPWADDSPYVVHAHANYYGTGDLDIWEGLAPTGSFPPNQFGIYDLCGNAFEWVYDPWTYEYLLSGAVSDPVGVGWWNHGDIRVIRGGGFNFHWQGMVNGYRSGELWNRTQSYIGFRVVRNGSDAATGSVAVIPSRGAKLAPAHPNPFNPRTSLSWSVPVGAREVTLRIHDARGRQLRDLGGDVDLRGEGTAVWDGRSDAGAAVASGVYYAVLRVDDEVQVQKLSLIR